MAYLLDTNVVSELRKGTRCTPRVREWSASMLHEEMFLSVLVMGEIRRGIEIRRLKDALAARNLENWFRGLEIVYGNRILPVTADICDVWGRLSLREALPIVDGLLAATALHHRLTFVTRNKRDVARSGVDCFDPFVD